MTTPDLSAALDAAREMIALRAKAARGRWFWTPKNDLDLHFGLFARDDFDLAVLRLGYHQILPERENMEFITHAANHAAAVAESLIAAEAKRAKAVESLACCLADETRGVDELRGYSGEKLIEMISVELSWRRCEMAKEGAK